LILCSERAYALFREGGGTIVNVLSTAGQVPRPGQAAYCAAKWGARGYTETLRTEAIGSPVRIVAVYPGGMRTRFWPGAGNRPREWESFMDPGDVADAIVRALGGQGSGYVGDLTIRRKEAS